MVSKLLRVETVLGIGIGFILSAILVGFFPPERPLTNKEIIEQAQELGMLTEEEHTNLLKTELDKAKGAPVVDKSQKTQEPEENQAPQESQQTAIKTVKVTIPKGSNSDRIAKILIASGVKTDLQSFQKAVDQLGANRKFQVGNFVVPVEGDEKQLISILTKHPNT